VFTLSIAVSAAIGGVTAVRQFVSGAMEPPGAADAVTQSE